ncbi:MAG: hypothetical protein EBX38_00620 [Actinobacteria bacterium]|nr:hypothetical protein [Actinomycetota bacterium]
MDTLGGIPSHPLFVHLPAVLIPLATLGVILMVVRPTWWQRYQWATLAVTGVGTLGAILAAGSGEALEEGVEDTANRSQLHAHVEAGEAARTMSIVFFVVALAAIVVVPWVMKRRSTQLKLLRAVVALVLVASAGAASWTVFDAGHSGAKSVWSDVKVGEGGEHGEQGGDHD